MASSGKHHLEALGVVVAEAAGEEVGMVEAPVSSTTAGLPREQAQRARRRAADYRSALSHLLH